MRVIGALWRGALRRRGYIAVSEVRTLLEHLGKRLAELDAPLAREYMLDPYPGGLERKIALMCRRRQTLFAHLAEEALNRVARDQTAPAASADKPAGR